MNEWSPLRQEPEAPYSNATSREVQRIPLPAEAGGFQIAGLKRLRFGVEIIYGADNRWCYFVSTFSLCIYRKLIYKRNLKNIYERVIISRSCHVLCFV
jgi:hypothetical protein